MIGLRFKVKNEYNNYLQKIFLSVNVERYDWDIISDEIIDAAGTNKSDGIFASECANGQQFLESISKNSYYVIFADLKAFPIGSRHTLITTFMEFLCSTCEMVLLCVDSEFYEFFCKDESILQTVYGNCIANRFEAVEYLSSKDCFDKYLIAF